MATVLFYLLNHADTYDACHQYQLFGAVSPIYSSCSSIIPTFGQESDSSDRQALSKEAQATTDTLTKMLALE